MNTEMEIELQGIESEELQENITSFRFCVQGIKEALEENHANSAILQLTVLCNEKLIKIKEIVNKFSYKWFKVDFGKGKCDCTKKDLLKRLNGEIDECKGFVENKEVLSILAKECKDEGYYPGIATYFKKIDENWFYRMLDNYPFEMTEIINPNCILTHIQQKLLEDAKFNETFQACEAVKNFYLDSSQKLSDLPETAFGNDVVVLKIIEIITDRIYKHFEIKIKASHNGEKIKEAIDKKIEKSVEEIHTKRIKYLQTKMDNDLEAVDNYEI